MKMTQEVSVRGPSVGCLVIIITLCRPAYCTFAALAAAIRSLLLPNCEGPRLSFNSTQGQQQKI